MATHTELGQLIDCPEEEFRKFCEDKDLGYLRSFHNLMVQTYNQVQDIKNDLVVKSRDQAKMTPQYKDTLNGLYAKLLRIEQRVFILRDYIKDIQKRPLEVSNRGT